MYQSHSKAIRTNVSRFGSIFGFLALVSTAPAHAQGLATGTIEIIPNTDNTNYVASATEWVTMGLPFASCTVSGASRNDQFKLLDDMGAEVPVFVRETLTWPASHCSAVESTRAIKVQFLFDATGGAKTYSWDLTGRTTPLTSDELEAPVAEVATDIAIKGPLMEPVVFAIHDDDYLVQTLLVPPTVGLTTNVYDTDFYQADWIQHAVNLNYTTSTRGNWLFDRVSTLYRQSMRRGDVDHYREAYLSHEFVIERIDDGTVPDPAQSSGDGCVGCFAYGAAAGNESDALGDPKYVYTENIRLHLALTGDDSWTPDANTYANTRDEMWNQMASILVENTNTSWNTRGLANGIVKKDGFIEPYDLADIRKAYTERKSGIGLTTVLNSCQLTGDATVCGWADTIVDNIHDHQLNNPGGPGFTGYLGHSWMGHENLPSTWVGTVLSIAGSTVTVENVIGDVGHLTSGETIHIDSSSFGTNNSILAANATDLGGGQWQFTTTTVPTGAVGTNVWAKDNDSDADRSFSPWMTSQVADAVWQYYHWTQNAGQKTKAEDILYGLGVAIAKYGYAEMDRDKDTIPNPTDAVVEAAFSTPGETLDFYFLAASGADRFIFQVGCGMSRLPFPYYASNSLLNLSGSGVNDAYMKSFLNLSADFGDQHVPDMAFMLSLGLFFETDPVKRNAFTALIEDSQEWYETHACTAGRTSPPPRIISWENKTDPFGTYQWVSSFAIEYSADTLTEAIVNDGSITETLTLTIGGTEFENKVYTSPGDFEVTNFPPGMVATLTRLTATTAELALTSNATSNDPVNNIANMTVEIKSPALLGGFDAARISNSIKADIAVEFVNPLISYDVTEFVEHSDNDGSIGSSITLDLTGDIFTTAAGPFPGSDFSVTGLTGPLASLTANLSATSNTQAVLTLTGNVGPPHGNASDIGGIGFSFEDGAFTSTATAAGVTDSSNTLSIDFSEPALSYSGTTFTEDPATNDGAISTILTVTLTDDTFAIPAAIMTNPTHFTVVNLPTTLAVVITGTSATTATVELTGNADAHLSGNDVADLTVNFLPAAFTSTTNVSEVAEASRGDLAITFTDASLIYGATIFVEAPADDGSISTVASLTLVADDFVVSGGVMDVATHYTVANVPAGLTVVVTGTGLGSATVALTGNAASHLTDVSNLTITFLDAAFVSANAASVFGFSRNDLVVDYQAAAPPPPSGGGGGGSVIAGEVPNLVVPAGSEFTNLGVLIDLNNAGTVIGGRVSGDVTNEPGGVLQGVTLDPGTVVSGGTLTGELEGEGETRDALLDITGIDPGVIIGPGTQVTQETVDNVPGLDLTGAIRDGSGELNLLHPLLVDEDGNEQTVLDLALRSVNGLLGNSDSSVNDVNGDGAATIENPALGDAIVHVTPSGVETTSDADGVLLNERGELTIIEDGIKMTFSPGSADSAAFTAGLDAAGAGSDLLENGLVQVSFRGGVFFFQFSYVAIQPDTSSSFSALSTGEASFSAVGSLADPATFRIVVTYPEGETQELLPALHDIDGFAAWLDAGDYSFVIDGVTGIIIVSDGNTPVFRGIPDYSLLDSVGLPGTVDFNTSTDLNQDGVSDIYFDTEASRQVIYGLPLQ